ncbi:hypothetical protein M5361_10895 [Ligilactobacillus agilis]|nr:hypothetical protein [Ligilactobacillus agilis]
MELTTINKIMASIFKIKNPFKKNPKEKSQLLGSQNPLMPLIIPVVAPAVAGKYIPS